MGRIVTRVMFRVTKLIITCTQIQGLTRPHALPEELQFFSLGFLIVILLQKPQMLLYLSRPLHGLNPTFHRTFVVGPASEVSTKAPRRRTSCGSVRPVAFGTGKSLGFRVWFWFDGD